MDDQKRLKILLINSFGDSVVPYAYSSVLSDSSVVDKSYIKTLTQNLTAVQRETISHIAREVPNTPRMSGCYIMATKLREEGHYVEVLELLSCWTRSEFYKWKENHIRPFDVVGFSTSLVASDGSKASVAEFKKFYNYVTSFWPKALKVVGAMHYAPTLYHTEYGISPDYVVSGYGERAFTEIINHKFYSGPSPKFKLLHNNIKHVDAIEWYPTHLDNQDYSYELVDQDVWDIDSEAPTVELNRGCPFKCSFCNFPLIGVKEDTSSDVNLKKTRHFLQQAYDNYGFTHFNFGDDTTNSKTDTLERFANEVVGKLSFQPTFSGFIRMDLMRTHPEQISLCKQIGMTSMLIGVDTIHRETGKIVGKAASKEVVFNTLRNIYREYDTTGHMLHCDINMIGGLPKCSDEQFVQDVMSLQELNRELGWRFRVKMTSLIIIPDGYGQPNAFGLNMSKYNYAPMSIEESAREFYKHLLKYSEADIKPSDIESFKKHLENNSNPNFILWKKTDEDSNMFKTLAVMSDLNNIVQGDAQQSNINTGFVFSNLKMELDTTRKYPATPYKIIPIKSFHDYLQEYVSKKLLTTKMNAHLIPN